jgi:thiol-disulfide isomerase/thioredoxin
MVKKAYNAMQVKKGTLLYWVLAACIFILILFIVSYLLNIKSFVHKKQEDYMNNPEYSIIYAFSKSCPHCIKFEGTFEKKSKEFINSLQNNNIEVKKYERSEIPSNYSNQIDGFPTVLIYKGGEFVKKTVGNMPGEQFLTFLKSAI